MDRWEESINRIKQGLLAEEPEAALAGALELLANFGRTLEVIASDTYRIANALEGKTTAPVPSEDTPAEPQVHDL